ncbi:helix-turn-helix domain-containing protein [Streptomyces sp. DSM 41527]|uniref:Helix-turn-helix domain-containing protein n=1 Tax=Streptomyces mooreae TaxID=3075523 RepID=A0ABU2TAD0_9ACTN|nr:helix-turn-helix domain-containing protein [Streptomyces sp. DSM 41527]MDT0457907.1 helix-turn-helix domain-containing protein [Streptomyces sp. DSM 41527]
MTTGGPGASAETTDPDSALPALSGTARSLAARCAPRVNALARQMSRGAFEQLHGYAELPADVKDVEIAATARHGLRLFLDRVTHDPDPRTAPGDFDVFRERAAQRAEEGMPLPLLLTTHCVGVRVLWQALRDAARPGEEAALVELAGYLFATEQRIVRAVTETYLDEQAALAAERHAGHPSLVRGLLEGTTPPPAGSGLDGPSLVLFVQLPGGPRATVAARRVGRRLQAALDRAFGREVPALLDGTGGRAIVPGAAEPPPALAGLLDGVCGPGARLAAVHAETGERIPEAARTAARIVRVARACGHPAGLHRLDDVLLEYQLSRPSAGSDRIAALLDPVAGRPELIETLRTHLEQAQDRRATARLLTLHPNTVDNRLARFSTLTGLDLSTPRGAALALAAFLLRDAEEEPGRPASAGKSDGT